MDKKELVKLMVGRDLKDMFVKEFGKQDVNDAGNFTLEVEKLSIKGLFEDISFKVRKGEVLGISGLMGAGRTEVMEAVFGLRKIDSGKIKVHGKNIKIKNPRTAIKNGMAFITEDRKIYGLNLLGTVKTNITMT
jgi:ABC-type sugar transport system ATPase subunit